MKRIIAIVMMSLFGFAFGCGGAATEAPTTPETAEEAAPAEEAAAEEGAADEAAADEAAPADGAAEATAE